MCCDRGKKQKGAKIDQKINNQEQGRGVGVSVGGGGIDAKKNPKPHLEKNLSLTRRHPCNEATQLQEQLEATPEFVFELFKAKPNFCRAGNETKPNVRRGVGEQKWRQI